MSFFVMRKICTTLAAETWTPVIIIESKPVGADLDWSFDQLRRYDEADHPNEKRDGQSYLMG